MLAKYSKSYKKLSWLVKVIVAIIPITSWVNAILYRFSTGHVIAGILAIPFGFIFWVLDLITVVLSGKPTIFA